MREDVSDDTRISSAPNSLVPPGTAPFPPTGQLADKSVKLVKGRHLLFCFHHASGHGKRVARVGLSVRLPRVPLYQRRRRSDGHAPSHGHRGRALAYGLDYLWRDNRLPRSLKLRLYAACVCSTLTHDNETWILRPRTLATLNGFNSRQLQRITGRSIASMPPSPRTTFWRLCGCGGTSGGDISCGCLPAA